MRLQFDRGTLLLDDLPAEGFDQGLLPGWIFDRRVRALRAPAWRYREALTTLHRAGIALENSAGGFAPLELLLRDLRQPYPHQQEAVEAWWRAGKRGVVVLPTGAGKTFVAVMAIARLAKSALVITPTIDLLQQWYGVLKTAFDTPIGMLGGGSYEIHPITVSTYDSAHLHMERLGDRFALLIFDECHHLPGPTYSLAAELSIAPFRLGLSATPERDDGGETRLDTLIGPLVFRREITELAGLYLADYDTVTLRVHLSEEEREAYESAREIYRGFLQEEGLRLGGKDGWRRFLQLTCRSERGRRAFLAYRAQRTIAQASEAKLRLLETLLHHHHEERIIVFTSDNETVYKISRRFLIPAITHQTKAKERYETLKRFADGSLPFLVTSRVLNEGVDVPEASIGIVLSGSGSVREHVQRLGRILRRGEGKRAILYEVIAEDTGEEHTSQRRRQHGAYQR